VSTLKRLQCAIAVFGRNVGVFAMFVEVVFINSEFCVDPFNAIVDCQSVGTPITISRECSVIDFVVKFANGEFVINATGRGEVSGLECFNEAASTF
jgi:hypothetical protein